MGGAEEEEKGADASPQAEQVTVGRFNEWRESPETKLQEVFICPKRGKNSLKVGLPLWTCCYLRKKKKKIKKKEKGGGTFFEMGSVSPPSSKACSASPHCAACEPSAFPLS